MRRLLIVPILLVLLMTSCDENGKKREIKTYNDSLSYAIGNDMAMNFEKSKLDSIDIDVFAAGMKDYYAKDSSIMTSTDIMNILQAFSVKRQQEMQAEQMKAQIEQEAKDKVTFKDNIEKGETFLKENSTKAGVKTTASGLQYKVIKEGKGKIPAASDKVKVHYKGTLLDGTEFDSSYSRGEPIEIGAERQVIRGWQEALLLMKVGAKYELYIPYNLAYGPRGAGKNIAPYSTLIFEVELISIVK